MISTKKFRPTPNQLFIVSLSRIFGRTLWKIYPFLYTLIVIFIPKKSVFNQSIIFFLTLYPIVIIILEWIYTKSPDNKAFYRERYLIFEADKMRVFVEDGSESTVMLSSFTRLIEKKKYYLLFISKVQFYYIPKDCFQSTEDQDWFEEVFLMKLKNHN